MNVVDLRARVRNLIFEPAGSTGLVTDAQVDEFVNMANRKVWKEAAAASQSYWTKRSPALGQAGAINWSSATGYFDFSGTGLDPFGIQVITYLQAYVGTTPETVEPVIPQDRGLSEPSRLVNVYPTRPFRYYIEGEKLYFTPPPSSDQQLLISYIPKPPKLGSEWVTTNAYKAGDVVIPTSPNGHQFQAQSNFIAGAIEPTWNTVSGGSTTDGAGIWKEIGSDQALSGKLDLHHDAVGWQAAIYALSKDEDERGSFSRELNDLMKQLLRDVRRRQTQRSRRQRPNPY